MAEVAKEDVGTASASNILASKCFESIMTTATATTRKQDTRSREMSTWTGYKGVEGIEKDREEPFRRGISTVTVKGLGFKGEA